MNIIVGLVSVSIFLFLVQTFYNFGTSRESPLPTSIAETRVIASPQTSSLPEYVPTYDPQQITLTLTTTTLAVLTTRITLPTETPLPTSKNSAALTLATLPQPSSSPSSKPILLLVSTPLPTASPSYLLKVATSAEIDAWFSEFAASQSVSEVLLRKIAICESGYKQFARNGIYGGLFQFSPNSWTTVRRTMNLDANPDLRFDAKEAIKSAAFQIATRGIVAWENCL